MTATPRKTDPTPAALQDAVDALARLGCKPTKSGDGYTAYCPIHESDGSGHKPSLNLKAGDTQAVVVRCHAGCDWKEILKALDITPAPSHNGKRRIVATYSYRDLDGREAFQKIRYEPKDFLQRWPDGQGGWLWKRPGNAPPVAAVPDSESGEFTRHDTRLRRKSGSSEVLKSLPNAITICENLIPGLIGFNAFRQRIEARIPAPWRKSPGAWGDYDTAELAALISSRYFPDFSPDKLLTAIMVVARRNEFNPAQDRLRVAGGSMGWSR
jgi:hypothetical protein